MSPLGSDIVAQCEPEWAALAQDAVELNPFMEPLMIRPALAHLCGPNAMLLEARRGDRLIGLAVLEPSGWFGRLPAQNIRNLSHRHLFLGAPLVRNGEASSFARALFDWLDGYGVHSGAFVVLKLLRGDGPIERALRERALEDKRVYREVDVFERAFVKRGGDYESHVRRVMSSQSRKRLRAKRRKLENEGALAHEILNAPDHACEWLDGFLSMEHAGWKGAAGTSILSSDNDTAFWREFIADAMARERLRFARLTLNGQPIAYTIDVTAGRSIFALKIAHDRAYDKFSPGVLLEHENLKAFLDNPRFDWIDSCAAAEHPVLSGLWPDRARISRVVIGRKSAATRFKLDVIFALFAGARSVRQMAGAAMNLVRADKSSATS